MNFTTRKVSFRLAAVLLSVAFVLFSPLPAPNAHSVTNTWFTHGPAGRNSYSLAINPVTTTTVYTGTDNGVFKSTDAGESWTAATTGLLVDTMGDMTPRTVSALAHDPQATVTG